MNHLDLFSGIGGFALAARWAGINTVAFCEIEPFAQKVLKKNFPSVPVFSDICKLKRSDINESVDIITGGFPCQPFSVAGRKKGTKDDRDLWPEMFRIIKEFQPNWVIGENVANFVNMAFQRTKTHLESEGYEVQPLIIPACGVNAPHKRDRVWIVAHSDSKRRAKGNRPNSGVNEAGENAYREGQTDTYNIGRTSETAAYTQSIYVQRLDDRSGKGEPWGSGWWESEPYVGRVAHGVPNRVDRLKGLGNAIVPQVAYQIMKGIHENIRFYQ